MTASAERPRVNWQTVVIAGVVGASFFALGAATGGRPVWSAAAAISFIAAAESLWRQCRLPATAA